MPNPLSPYAAAKLAAEAMLLGYARSYDLEVICCRYFNVYGPRQDPGSPYSGVLSIFTERFRAGLPVTVHGDGEQARDFVSVEDVTEANCRALIEAKMESGCINVCTGRSWSLNQVLTRFADFFPDAPAPLYGPPRAKDIRHSHGDPDKLWRELALTPQVPFDQGLRDLVLTGK